MFCRSRSVGNDNHFSLCLSPYKQSVSNMSSIRYSNYSNGISNGGSGAGGNSGCGGISGDSGSSGNSGGLLNPFKATKKFFKKLV